MNLYYRYTYFSPVYHNSLKSVPKLIIHLIHLLLCRPRKAILSSTCVHSTHILSTDLRQTITMNPVKKIARNSFTAWKIHADKLAFYINTNEINLLTIWMNSTTCWASHHAGHGGCNEEQEGCGPLLVQSADSVQQKDRKSPSNYNREQHLFWYKKNKIWERIALTYGVQPVTQVTSQSCGELTGDRWIFLTFNRKHSNICQAPLDCCY